MVTTVLLYKEKEREVMLDAEVHDYGDDPRDQDACWQDFLKTYIRNSTGWIVVSVQWEDKAFYIFRCKSEKEAKKEYLENVEESESHDDDFVFHDGKDIQIKKTIEFVGVEEELEEMS